MNRGRINAEQALRLIISDSEESDNSDYSNESDFESEISDENDSFVIENTADSGTESSDNDEHVGPSGDAAVL